MSTSTKSFLADRAWIIQAMVVFLNIIYFLVFFGIYFISKPKLYILSLMIHCITFLYLVIRFNIFSSIPIVIQPMEKQIIFSITSLLFFNTVFYDLDVIRFLPDRWKNYWTQVHNLVN